MSSSSSECDRTGANVVVIELGSSLIKVGLAGYDSPRLVPNLVGTQRDSNELVMLGTGSKEYYYGKEAVEKKGILNIRYPVQRGIVQDWDCLEKIFHYIYDEELRISPENSGVLITESVLNPKNNSERLYQLFFETFKVPAILITTDSLLSMIATGGMQTGLVVNSGAGVTTVVPFYQGYVIECAIRKFDLGGDDVTRYLSRLLLEAGYSFTTSAELEIVRNMKESLAYTVQDFNREMVDFQTEWNPHIEKYYKLPDGNCVTISTQRFECSECLFHPSHLGREHKGIQNLIHDSIQACGIDIRREISKNIILSGGNTMFPGMPERIHREIVNLSPPKSFSRVISLPNRKYLTWEGGSIMASQTSHCNPWIESREYNEMGPISVHRKRY